MKTKCKIVLFFICFCAVAGPLRAQCAPYKRIPLVQVDINYGKIFYDNTKANKDFPMEKYDKSVRGLTVCELKTSAEIKPFIKTIGKGQYCVGIEKLSVDIGFPQIDIYIEKKYKPGSCNYTVVKTHENYHARVQQEGLKFFSGKLKKAYQMAAQNIEPRLVTSESGAKAALREMIGQITTTTQPTISYVSEQLKIKNKAIDTEESYTEETKKCPKW